MSATILSASARPPERLLCGPDPANADPHVQGAVAGLVLGYLGPTPCPSSARRLASLGRIEADAEPWQARPSAVGGGLLGRTAVGLQS